MNEPATKTSTLYFNIDDISCVCLFALIFKQFQFVWKHFSMTLTNYILLIFGSNNILENYYFLLFITLACQQSKNILIKTVYTFRTTIEITTQK